MVADKAIVHKEPFANVFIDPNNEEDQDRYCDVVAEEEFARWLPLHETAKTRRDALAAELRDLYIPFINEFANSTGPRRTVW